MLFRSGGNRQSQSPRPARITGFAATAIDTLMQTFQQTILRLQQYWDSHGCALLQPYDMEVGAGTSHTATFLRAIRVACAGTAQRTA